MQVSKKHNCKANILVSERSRFFWPRPIIILFSIQSNMKRAAIVSTCKRIRWDTDPFALRIGQKRENFLNPRSSVKHDFVLNMSCDILKTKIRIKCFDETGPGMPQSHITDIYTNQ